MLRTITVCIALMGCLTTLACNRSETAKTPEPAAKLDPNAPEMVPSEEAEGIAPVYPETDVELAPMAERLCDALYRLPSERKAACCASKPPTHQLARRECTRMLSIALTRNAVVLDSAKVDACIQAQDVLHQGCGWVNLQALEPPAACRTLLAGMLAKDQRCRSDLECASGLHCFGAGPTLEGSCQLPRAHGTECGTSIDTLATYTRQGTDPSHAECQGYCKRSRCLETTSVGTPCTINLECGEGHHCDRTVCVAGAKAMLGQSCADTGCEVGARCIAGRCAKPSLAGERCERPQDCLGACDQAAGVCVAQCSPQFPGRQASK